MTPACAWGVGATALGSTFGSAQDAIDAVLSSSSSDAGSVTVRLCVGVHPLSVALSAQELVVTGAVDDGSQVVIVPAADGPIFQLAEGSTLDLSKLSIAQGNADSGGAILAQGSAISLSSVVIRDCREVQGGALDLRADAGQTTTLTAQDVILRDNKTDGAGAAVTTSGAGEIALRITGGEIVDNTAAAEGGALYLAHQGGGLVVLDGVILSRNQAHTGGAAYLMVDDAEITLRSCVFEANLAETHGGALAIAGGTFGSTVAIDNSTLSANVSGRNGGALWMVPNSTQLTVVDSELSDNLAGESGGALYQTTWAFEGDLVVSNTVLTDNEAIDLGGAVAIVGTGPGQSVVVEGSTLTGNKARLGGAIYTELSDPGGSTLTISLSQLDSNSAAQDGGALAVTTHADGLVELVDASLSGNTANSGGGAVLLQTEGELSVSALRTVLDANTAGRAGALLQSGEGSAALSLTDCAVTSNVDGDAAVYLTATNLISTTTAWGSGDTDNSPADLLAGEEVFDDLGDSESFACTVDEGCVF